jgi:hypothetical protein
MAVERTSEEREGQASCSRRDAVLRTYGILAGVAPGRSLSDELIAERREEARREDAAEDSSAHAA